MIMSPSSLNHCVVICFSSSISPTIAIVGVGSTTDVDATPSSRAPCDNSGDEGVAATVSLYNETFPPVTGVSNARQASATPSTASRNCQKFSGLYGLPKFKQSVTANGRAPEQVRLRAASATAILPPSRGSSAE